VVAYSTLIKSTNEIREKVDEKDMKKRNRKQQRNHSRTYRYKLSMIDFFDSIPQVVGMTNGVAIPYIMITVVTLY
jgi:hypothetical protein